MINLDNYPLMSKLPLFVRPMTVFKVEGVPITGVYPEDHGNDSLNHNLLMVFTGVLSSNDESGSDYLYCVPLMTYNKGSDGNYSNVYPFIVSQGVWLEIKTTLATKTSLLRPTLSTPGIWN